MSLRQRECESFPSASVCVTANVSHFHAVLLMFAIVLNRSMTERKKRIICRREITVSTDQNLV